MFSTGNQHLKHFVFLIAACLASCMQIRSDQEHPIPVSETTATLESPSNELTITPTLFLTPTWTPVTKLSDDEAFARFLALYEDNGNCELPCWWGITPGKSLWSGVHDQLSPIGTIVFSDKVDEMASYAFIYNLPKKIDALPDQLSANFIVEENKVQGISIGSRWVARNFDYSLAGLLEQFGQPTEIWLRLFPESVDGIPHYDMQVFFLDIGLTVWMNGDATVENGVMTICPAELAYAGHIIYWIE